uniref:6,7-dimethyl-8-ribityllumazine synthase n=2 Tax=Hemiselmis andersenii TaxID=464988 RepID=A0A7S0TRQ1_HEMAN|mmetsp:Transcript_23703/g.54565  ORF Transcript_23703/g.54565 Transcript_23703/m.54565 type:complete len:236 (+) Transcript_23703:3-710(+)
MFAKTAFGIALLSVIAPCDAFAPSSLIPGRLSSHSAALTHGARSSAFPTGPSLRTTPTLASPQMATKGIDFPALDGKETRVGIVYTRWNAEVVDKLRDGSKKGLTDICGVQADNIVEFEVPGAWELPVAARYMALTQKVDAVIAIGVLVKGETDHYDMIKDAACSALMTLQLETGIPVLNGILGCHDMSQAEARATGDNNHGVWWGQTAVEMALLRATQMGKVSADGEVKKKVMF